MRTVLLVAAVACVALAANLALDFQADVNLTNAEADFAFRYTFAEVKDIDLTVVKPKFLVWSSGSVEASASKEAKAKGDGMVGLGILPAAGIPPISLFAYGSGAAAIDVNADTMWTNLFTKSAKLETEFQAGVVGVAALSLYEVDPDGKTVGDVFLIRPSFTCDGNEINGDEGNLTGLSCNFKAHRGFLGTSTVEVTVTYITSKKAGILGYGNTPVSPRSFEMVLEVKDFPLSKKENHVRMDLGFLSVAAGIDLNASATEVIHREGEEDIYIAASERAVVGKDLAKINVTIEANPGTADIGDIVKAALQLALGTSFDSRITHIDFPVGAKSFVYDPAVGAGTAVYAAVADSAATSALSILIALICILVYLF